MAETMVLLSYEHEQNRAFNISHAQRLLNLQRHQKVQNGWQLTDQNFTLQNGVIQLRNKGSDKKPQSKKPATKSAKARTAIKVSR